MNRPLEAELHALADGRLTQQRAAEVEAWLDEHPEEAVRIHAWQAQKEALHGAFDPVLDLPLPERLRLSATRARRPAVMPRMAACLMWLVIGVLLGFGLRSNLPTGTTSNDPVTLPHQAALAHAVYTPEVRHPVEVGVDQEAHLVQWLSKRLGSALLIPKLTAQGYQLVGGRLLPAGKGPAAQFMYQDSAGVRLTLYVQRDAGSAETAFRFASEGKLGVFYWIDGDLSYALSGELPREQLLAVAEIAYRQLNAR